jgi:hypothetical protein
MSTPYMKGNTKRTLFMLHVYVYITKLHHLYNPYPKEDTKGAICIIAYLKEDTKGTAPLVSSFNLV